MHLVEGDSAEELSILVANVQIRDFSPPAVDDLHAAGGVEQDVSVRQIDTFVVCESEPEGKLADLAAGDVHFVEMVVVLTVGLLPGEQYSLAVIAHVRIANDTVGIVDERFDLGLSSADIQQAQRRTGTEVTFPLRVRQAFGVGVVRPAHLVVFGENYFLAADSQDAEPLGPPGGRRASVQILPLRIVSGNLGGGQLGGLCSKRLASGAEFACSLLDRFSF